MIPKFLAISKIVAPPTAAETNEIRELKPPVPIPDIWAWVWLAVGLLLLIAFLYGLWQWYRRRKNTPPPEIMVPPHERARQKLQVALGLIHQPRPFVIAVSDTIRVYLEERFDFRAPERTTEEFLGELQQTDLLASEQKLTLSDFLQRCDLVKFAKYVPAQPELQGIYDIAMRLVEETAPLPVTEGEPVRSQS